MTPEEVLALPDIRIGETLEECESVHDLKVCEEARYLIGFWLGRASTSPRKRPSAWLRKDPDTTWGPRSRNRIASQVTKIRHWKLFEGSYDSVPDVEATWFIDPPYQEAGTQYVFGSQMLDFKTLGEWCQSRRGQTVVCENVGADWLPFRPWRVIQSTTGVSKEAIWTND